MPGFGFSLEFPAIGNSASAPILPTATGYWNASDYVGGTYKRHIPNRNTSVGVENQIIAYPRGAFKYNGTVRLQWGNVGGLVATDNYADGPHAWDVGKSHASRIEIPIGSAATGYANLYQKTLASGTYTISVWMKSNTGSAQTARISWNGVTFVTCAVTTSWQRFTQTFSATTIFFPDLRGDGANALDILVCDYKAWVGGTAGTDLEPVGHMLFGDWNTTNWASATAGVLDFQAANGTYGIMSFLPFAAWSQGTVVVLASRTLTGTSAVSEDILFCTRSSRINFIARDWAATNVGVPELSFQGTSTMGGQANFITPYGKGYHVFAYAHGGAPTHDSRHPVRSYVDDMIQFDGGTVLAAGNTITDEIFQVGAYSAIRSNGYKIHAIAFWQGTVLTPTQVRQVGDELRTSAAAAGITANKWGRFVCFEGDSISTFGTSYGVKFAASYNSTTISALNGFAGSTIASLTARGARLDERIKPGSAKYILTVHIGANDLGNATSTASWLADLAAYCDARRAAGWYVILATVLPRGGVAGFNARRAVVNPVILTWAGVHADAIADFAGNATMGDDGDENNTTYYSDTIHPTDAGHTILASIMSPLINAALP